MTHPGPIDPADSTGQGASPDRQGRVSVFEMVRHEDVTGYSGVGVVAYGMEFPDRSVAFRWRGPNASTVVFDNIGAVIAVHGHGGATEIRWIASYGAADETGPTDWSDETGQLGTAWQRHDDPLWPLPDPNRPPFPTP